MLQHALKASLHRFMSLNRLKFIFIRDTDRFWCRHNFVTFLRRLRNTFITTDAFNYYRDVWQSVRSELNIFHEDIIIRFRRFRPVHKRKVKMKSCYEALGIFSRQLTIQLWNVLGCEHIIKLLSGTNWLRLTCFCLSKTDMEPVFLTTGLA